MPNPQRITREQANRRIAEWFEPKPPDKPQHYYEKTPVSPLGYWKWLGMGFAFGRKTVAPAQWCPSSYAHDLKAAWSLLCVKGSYDALVCEYIDKSLFLKTPQAAAREICEAFLFAITGQRFEIVDLNCLKIWPVALAPQEYLSLAGELGDAEWLILLPAELTDYPEAEDFIAWQTDSCVTPEPVHVLPMGGKLYLV